MTNVKFSDLTKDTQLGDNDLILKSTVDNGWSTISGSDLKKMLYPKEMREKSLSNADDLNQLFESGLYVVNGVFPQNWPLSLPSDNAYAIIEIKKLSIGTLQTIYYPYRDSIAQRLVYQGATEDSRWKVYTAKANSTKSLSGQTSVRFKIDNLKTQSYILKAGASIAAVTYWTNSSTDSDVNVTKIYSRDSVDITARVIGSEIEFTFSKPIYGYCSFE